MDDEEGNTLGSGARKGGMAQDKEETGHKPLHMPSTVRL